MKEKKNIERLFQERFKNFEVQPPDDAWNNISKELHPKKKTKKVIPFWFKLSGVAVVLLIGFLVLKNDFGTEKTDFTTNENQNIKPTNTPVFEGETITQTEIENIKETVSEKNQNKENENQVVYESDGNQKNKTDNSLKTSKKNVNQNLQTANSSINKKSGERSNQAKSKGFFDTEKTTEIVQTDKILAQEKTNSKDNNSTNPIDKNSRNQQKSEENLVFETITINPYEKNPLQELLEELNSEKENPSEEQIVFNRWKITPNVAPIMMNSTSEGSPISEQFSGNSKDFQTSVSYGLGINYALSEKLNIRTGINKFSVGYNTNDVVLYASADRMDVLSNRMNINFSDKSINIVLRPEQGIMIHNESFGYNQGYLDQRMGYLEVPVELSYKLLDKRFGIELIGGMSTLFLEENEISVVSNGMRTTIGKANNLNDVHFSTNLGVGFRYEIFKSFEASLEPMFKYQLGTFSKNDGNFKPYILGLYSGLSFKF